MMKQSGSIRLLSVLAAASLLAVLTGPTASAQPGGNRVYVANRADNTVSVLDRATNKVVATIPVSPAGPSGVVVTPDGARVYVAITGTIGSWCQPTSRCIAVIDTATNTVLNTPRFDRDDRA